MIKKSLLCGLGVVAVMTYWIIREGLGKPMPGDWATSKKKSSDVPG